MTRSSCRLTWEYVLEFLLKKRGVHGKKSDISLVFIGIQGYCLQFVGNEVERRTFIRQQERGVLCELRDVQGNTLVVSLNRLARKTNCFSRSKEMLEACLKIWSWG